MHFRNNNKYLTKSFCNDTDYYLGCVPTEEELIEFTSLVESQNEPNTVDINVFVPHMEKQIRAFRCLMFCYFNNFLCTVYKYI